jgi:hypothetical protein
VWCLPPTNSALGKLRQGGPRVQGQPKLSQKKPCTDWVPLTEKSGELPAFPIDRSTYLGPTCHPFFASFPAHKMISSLLTNLKISFSLKILKLQLSFLLWSNSIAFKIAIHSPMHTCNLVTSEAEMRRMAFPVQSSPGKQLMTPHLQNYHSKMD